ncbi:MAG TPA: glycosyltransferase family 2 protein [Clostridia bacterium]|nr:glycosyltransferase family 2 protein [Clostridia bacterium]
MKISVALAAYKGEKYLGEQLESILPQLGEMDEIIVSDDFPEGETRAVVEFYHAYDNRIKYIHGPGKGVCKNFENAILNCTGDYIFLCDQDDVWLPNKVEFMVKELENNSDLVMHNAMVTDGKLQIIHKSYFDSHKTHQGFVSNFMRNNYVGCCMAFKADFKDIFLPFPENLPMHDQWIGLLVELYGRVSLIDEPLILYRRHSNTVTGASTSFGQKLKWRFNLAGELLKRTSLVKKNRGAK